jgi:hypothetical protein
MKKIDFIVAGFIGLAFAILSAAPAQALPVGESLAPVVATHVTFVAQHCWRRASGRLVCAQRNFNDRRPYYEPYADYPAYRYDDSRIRDRRYGYSDYPTYPAYPYGDTRIRYLRYGYSDAYHYRNDWPYRFHEFYLPNDYDDADGFYGGPALHY